MTEAKNHKFLIEVFAAYSKTNPAAKLVLIGDGEYRDRIEAQIIRLNLKSKVLVLGKRSDIPEFMAIFDCFVFPSLYEGLPTVLIEAQSLGIPIVCSTNITSEVIVNGNVKQLDLNCGIDDWIEAINNSEKTNSISEGINNFKWETIVKKVEHIYDELCEY